jgi:hypothetical protein
MEIKRYSLYDSIALFALYLCKALLLFILLPTYLPLGWAESPPDLSGLIHSFTPSFLHSSNPETDLANFLNKIILPTASSDSGFPQLSPASTDTRRQGLDPIAR